MMHYVDAARDLAPAWDRTYLEQILADNNHGIGLDEKVIVPERFRVRYVASRVVGGGISVRSQR